MITKPPIGKRRGRTTHGLSKIPEYDIWNDIKKRCYNKKFVYYKHYGGRGIKMCEKWRHSFEDFIKDVGRRPSKDLQLGRIDNEGDYEPGNVRWESRIDNCNNRRSSTTLTLYGETKTVSQWAREIGVPVPTLFSRLYAGCDDAEVLFGRGVSRILIY